MENEINGELRTETAGRGPAIKPSVPRLTMAVCAALMVISMLLPLFTVTKEYAGYFDGYPEDHIDEKIFVDNPQKLSQNPVPSMVNTFLETIKQQAEEIGRLKAHIEELERERPVPAYARSTSKETVDL